MGIARQASGIRADLRALASQIHPVFMLPPVAASWFGAIIAVNNLHIDLQILPGVIHAVAIFFAVYTAHVKDGYVDFYQRGEDSHHPLTPNGCLIALAFATICFGACVGFLWALVGSGAALITAPTWVIGYLHAPQLDTNPVTATVGYPVGIALSILGGYYVQATGLSTSVLGYAAVFLVILTGVKIVDDAQDTDFDQRINKRTVAVIYGHRNARNLSDSCFAVAVIAVLWGSVVGTFPAFSTFAALVFGIVAVIARRATPTIATQLLIRGAYLFLAVLIIAVAFRPLSGFSLPDITLLGPYTYIATEIVFGLIAFALLVHADAVIRAVRTIVVLYPIAYVWDWYTLTVGVFEISMRTGVMLFDIPLEEHLFMIVVPALVLGVHETLRSLDNHDA